MKRILLILSLFLLYAGFVHAQVECIGDCGGSVDEAGNYTWTGTHTFEDANLSILDDADNSKIMKFQLSSITASNTRTLTIPDASITVAGANINNSFSVSQTFAAIPTSPGGAGTNNESWGSGSGAQLATGGNYNAFFAYKAGAAVTTGDHNTYVGYQAGLSNSTGNQNTAIGALAAYNASAGGNTCIGYSACGGLTSGTYNTAIGNSAFLSSNLSSTLSLGYASQPTANNQIVIGDSTAGANYSDLYFNGVTEATANSIVINSSGGSGTDIAGGDITLAGGKGTGAGDPGNVYFQVSTLLGTGTTLQTLSTKAGFTDQGYYDAVDERTIADNLAGGTPATLTLSPTSSFVRLTCNDPDTCDITMSETDVTDGQVLEVTNTTTNACDFADTGGVTELAGAFAMGQYDTLRLRYSSDRWVEISRSNN